MTIEAFFRQHEADGYTFPVAGDSVRFRKPGEDWQYGTVALVFAGIEPTVKLESGVSLYPTMGDEIEVTG